MNLLKDRIGKLYFRYLAAAFGSTLIMSIYSLVDTIVIGQYEGPDGSAAVVTFSPLWTLLFAMGLLLGIGGSVLMAQKRGEGRIKEGNEYFTVSLLTGIVISAVIFILYNLCARELLTICGARGAVLELALRYAHWISMICPLFVLGQILVPFIRNDQAPFLTTAAVLCGGIFNIFGDIYFVFGLNMGIGGAGLATALGQVISVLILLTHFLNSRCKLKLIRPSEISGWKKLRQIVHTGSSNFIIDIAMGLMAILFNNQILHYFGSVELAIYGVTNNIFMLLQTMSYAVGESAQAIISINYGAGRKDRVRETFRYSAWSALALGLLWFLIVYLFPTQITKLFMSVTPAVLSAAPAIIHRQSACYLLMSFNINATYYFQSVEKPGISITISLLRGILLGAFFVYVLPLVFGADAIWFTIPATELLVFLWIGKCLRKEFRTSCPVHLNSI